MNIIKWKGCTLQPLTKQEYDNSEWVGGCLQGYVDVTYQELIDLFGTPTLGISGDEKCQMEWVFEITDDEGNQARYTLYDWKTYDLNYTKTKLKTWNIGGNSSPTILQEYIKEQRQNNKEFTFSVPCSLEYRILAKNEEEAKDILLEKGGYEIQGEVLVEGSDYDNAILI
jgi:hypothetical protein